VDHCCRHSTDGFRFDGFTPDEVKLAGYAAHGSEVRGQRSDVRLFPQQTATDLVFEFRLVICCP
jgi:hypothetical protein